MQRNINSSIRNGSTATLILLAVYVAIVSFVSGWDFMLDQFYQFWYFVITLAIGFGIQIGLYSYLKNAIHHQNTSGKVLAVSGTTSTAAMISCCAHYLVNLLPILGIVGVVTVISQYQVQLFWVGIAFNLVGILYMGSRVIKFSKSV
ncbi:MAG: hypothetical protein KBC63_04365 [Candidatus Levybacteria bacterium]|nr:hypothetical protein [Candidatus Levybacteria bacterium]